MKKLKRILTSIMCFAMLSAPVFAYENIRIRVNGTTASVDAQLINSTTYVNLNDINTLLADASGTTISVAANSGESYLTARGRYIGGLENQTIGGSLYVPVRSIAEVYNTGVEWNDSTRSVDLSVSANAGITSGDSYYIEDEIYWLSRIINAEAKGEPMRGKILVGNVILNRTFSSEFPNSIYDVIFDDEYGVQFTPTINGALYETPSNESIVAAKICLDAYYISRDALYFLNPAVAASKWITSNRSYLTSIGSHDFYS